MDSNENHVKLEKIASKLEILDVSYFPKGVFPSGNFPTVQFPKQ